MAKTRFDYNISDLENEIWKPIDEFKNYYEVSNKGRVRAKPIFIRHDGIWNKDVGGYVKTAKIHRGYIDRYGYIHMKLCKNGKCNHRKIHRLVAMAFLDNPHKYKDINHIDGNKLNNSVDNLEWISRSQNMKHAYETGLMGKKDEGFKKLNDDSVREIKELLNKKMAIREIAKLFNVSGSTIVSIKNNKTWKHVI